MARLLGVRAQDWPERARGAAQVRVAAEAELSRLCELADALSVAAYSAYLGRAIASWERCGAPIKARGLMFGNRKAELGGLCDESRARLAAACGSGPVLDAAFSFVSRLEDGVFSSPEEMRGAAQEAIGETGGASDGRA